MHFLLKVSGKTFLKCLTVRKIESSPLVLPSAGHTVVRPVYQSHRPCGENTAPFQKVRPRNRPEQTNPKCESSFDSLYLCISVFSSFLSSFFFHPLIEHLIIVVNVSVIMNWTWLCRTYCRDLYSVSFPTHAPLRSRHNVFISLWLLFMFVSIVA